MEQGYTYRPSIVSGTIGIPDPTPPTVTDTYMGKDKFIIWHIQGGLGKNIAGTSLVKDIVRTYPDRKLVMVVSWPEVFLNNPDIHRVYQLGQAPTSIRIMSKERIALSSVMNPIIRPPTCT